MIKAFLKLPINFLNICKIYPPSVNDVYENDDYGFYHSIFTLSQEEIEDSYTEKNLIPKDGKFPTPFDFLLMQAYNDPESYQKIRDAFQFFCHEKITILFDKKEIMLCDLEEELEKIDKVEDLLKIPTINETNFFDFQNCIRDSLGEKRVLPPDPNMHPKKKAMLAKARLRDQVKAKSGKGISLETSIIAICCMGIGLTPLNIGNISLSAISDIMNTYQKKEKYDIDMRSLMAGADSKKVKPKYWISNND